MKKFKKTVCASDKNYLSEALDFIRESMKYFKIPKDLLTRTELLAEELVVTFVRSGPRDMQIDLAVRKRRGDVYIDICAPGREIISRWPANMNMNEVIDKDLDDPDLEKAIRAIVVNAQREKLIYSNDDGINRISIAVGKAKRSSLIFTACALLLGVLVGLVARFLMPVWMSDGFCKYALDPVKTVFMNALKIIVGPVVFFSIATCFSQFTNFAELGKVGAKVMGMYVLTTLIAALLAIGYSQLFHPGAWGAGLVSATAESVEINTAVHTSLLTTIINIVPDNFIKPFLESDTLQLIFLAVICGIAVGSTGEHSKKISSLFEALNELFLTITTMIARFIPLVAFCSVTMMIIQLEHDSLLSLLGMCGTFLLCIFSMMLVYGLLVMLIGHMNPVMFFKNAREGMLTSFALSSSSASMPTTMNVCTNKLGVSPTIAAFSIPLGATVNMDGVSISLIVLGLFLARMYAIPVSGTMLASLILTVIMLSLGAPGVPGAGLVCLGIILEHLGVPIEAIGLIMAIDPFIDMFSTMNNVTGDIAVTTIVAKTEGMLNMEVFHSRDEK